MGSMPEVIIPRTRKGVWKAVTIRNQKVKDAPIAIILHPHPQFGGTMNNRVVYNLHYAFHEHGLHRAAVQFPRRRPQPGRIRPG